jgi:hypothetical protein
VRQAATAKLVDSWDSWVRELWVQSRKEFMSDIGNISKPQEMALHHPKEPEEDEESIPRRNGY